MIFLSACPSACTFTGITVFSTCLAAFLYCDFPFNIFFYAFCDGIVYHSFCVYLHRYSCLPVLLCVSSPVFLCTCPSACIFTAIPVYLSFCVYLHRYSCLPILLRVSSPVFLSTCPSACSFVVILFTRLSACFFAVFLSTCPSACTRIFTGIPVYRSNSCMLLHRIPVVRRPVLLRLHLLLDFTSIYFTSARLIH
jgi:hypothetical protein